MLQGIIEDFSFFKAWPDEMCFGNDRSVHEDSVFFCAFVGMKYKVFTHYITKYFEKSHKVRSKGFFFLIQDWKETFQVLMVESKNWTENWLKKRF